MALASLQDAINRPWPGPAAGVSRRDAIAAGGLAIAGAAGLMPTTSPPIGIVFGADRSGYRGFHHAAPLAVGLRWYFNMENQLPPAWPEPFPGTHMTLSLRPNPSDLFADKLDSRMMAIINSAPAHSELTFWNAKRGLAHGGLDGPWPPSRSVIRTLASLAREYDWKTS